MKKLVISLAIILGMTLTTFAQGGGLFHRGNTTEQADGFMNRGSFPGLPSEGHGSENNGDADPAPMGTGIAILACLGAAYMMAKKRKD